ncbi:hypothetical protein [Methylomonas albis]|nr:hypothetical protein [Methylomonas albis]
MNREIFIVVSCWQGPFNDSLMRTGTELAGMLVNVVPYTY